MPDPRVVSPFRIEEMFPDVAHESVRLPRRQSGSSPQSLAVTLLADYTVHTRAWLPSGAIVALLAESGVSTVNARAAISRLARRGILESSRQGRLSFYRLTKPAADNLVRGGIRIAAFAAAAESWDGRWTVIAFSLPQTAGAQRRGLRGQLRWRGYAPLYDGLWVSPHPLDGAFEAELGKLPPGTMTVFQARHLELAATTSRNPIDAWDTAALAGEYDSFVRRWEALLPQVRAGSVTGAAAVRARTGVMDTYRRFPILDPRLPLQLMPAGWPRREARAVFAGVYDGLAGPAADHVRSVADQAVPGADPEIRAHTVADLAT